MVETEGGGTRGRTHPLHIVFVIPIATRPREEGGRGDDT